MEKKKSGVFGFIILLIIFIIAGVGIYYILDKKNEDNIAKTDNETEESVEKVQAEIKPVTQENEYAIKDNNLSKFDLSFLKFENERKNKIYSPLSIKYAFKMLEEGTEGEAHDQIASIIQAYNLTEYSSNNKMAFGNAFFVRDSFKDKIKENYINNLRTKFNADVQFDDFSSADSINKWVNDHTLNLIPQILDDSEAEDLQFALINALGIDMEWKHKFLKYYYEDDENIHSEVYYNHARIPNEEWSFGWIADQTLWLKKFDNNQKVSSMKVYASLNNYDPIKDLGEEKIYNDAYEDFKEYALGYGKKDSIFENNLSEENIKKVFDDWFYHGKTEYYEGGSGNNVYIDGLKENYGREDYSTDFSLYVNDDVKVFAKDLEEVDGTTLQYIGIMPIKQDLNNYIENTTNEDIKKLIGNLKELKRENFRDGYLTWIHGYIPKFDFEYELNLMEDLEKLGVTDVFESGKANLSKISDDSSLYIGDVKHKANIEFTQDGIKAAAATMVGGLGAGDWYDYFVEMPTDDIDITFDKPYMFLIRDKGTGETWIVGTVYEPLSAEDEKETNVSEAYEER